MVVDEERFVTTARNLLGEKGKQKDNEALWGTWLGRLGKISSGSATQHLWLGGRKVGSQGVGEDRSRLPGRGSDGEVRRER